jgi:hypothetical protein
MDLEVFARGAHTPESGGPKGLDIDATSSVLAVTSEAQPLAFFDLPALLEHATALDQRDRDFRHELWMIDATHQLARRAREYGGLIRYLRDSRSWRLTAPLRRLDSAWRRRR